MKMRRSSVIVVGAALLGAVSLGGCATKKFVREEVAVVGTRVDTVEGRVTTVEGTARDALERATAAGKLAEGKFLFSEVLTDDSMKFAVDKADLSPEAMARLDAFVEKLKSENRNVYVEVQGHTDITGAKDYNYKLGEERAEAVRRYLNQKGVALNRIGTISYGPDAPAAPNETRDGRQQNRRVVLIVLA
ncbi:MAG: OmpA family protein [Phenylobacterium sp.]|uniref:OmpA family protein n=1 Tax=Phenylobacterium sp. TaxID=1871053 RepID=UPI001A50C1F5|nr:OmpA family protein [Phenylobacterium sp.]MBL8773949.1 OmpA family protein [Phenylobacterium sp.]